MTRQDEAGFWDGNRVHARVAAFWQRLWQEPAPTQPPPAEVVLVEPSPRLCTVLGWFGCNAWRLVAELVKRRLLHVRCTRCGGVAREWDER